MSDWVDEGWKRVTVASNSAELVYGITCGIATWQERRWRERNGYAIENRELWEKLLFLVNELASQGVEARFWLIDRKLNKDSRVQARKAQRQGLSKKAYTRFVNNDPGR